MASHPILKLGLLADRRIGKDPLVRRCCNGHFKGRLETRLVKTWEGFSRTEGLHLSVNIPMATMLHTIHTKEWIGHLPSEIDHNSERLRQGLCA